MKTVGIHCAASMVQLQIRMKQVWPWQSTPLVTFTIVGKTRKQLPVLAWELF